MSDQGIVVEARLNPQLNGFLESNAHEKVVVKFHGLVAPPNIITRKAGWMRVQLRKTFSWQQMLLVQPPAEQLQLRCERCCKPVMVEEGEVNHHWQTDRQSETALELLPVCSAM